MLGFSTQDEVRKCRISSTTRFEFRMDKNRNVDLRDDSSVSAPLLRDTPKCWVERLGRLRDFGRD